MDGGSQLLPNLTKPITIGTRSVRNRILLPPHAASVGALFGAEDEARRNLDYWASRAEAGVGWVAGLSGFVDNILPAGVEPSGIGSRAKGIFRRADFLDRVGRYASRVQAAGALASCQLIMQGGMPHGPGDHTSGPTINAIPHGLTIGEIQWFVEEYRFSAARAKEAGLDGIEIHANHDDLMQWFLSPRTNRRGDGYGGDLAGRMRFLSETLRAIRSSVGDGFIVGVRLNVLEAEAGGYDAPGGVAIARWLSEHRLVDYLHLVIGTPWGDPSYVQSHHHPQALGARLAAEIRRQVAVPTVYAGNVQTLECAETIVARGEADLVGLARPFLVERDLIGKTLRGESTRIRRCIGCNECLARGFVEGLPLACPVNPAVGSWDEVVSPAARSREILVIGGGPAGIEFAATASERGHRVTLIEQSPQLGGQARLAGLLPTQAPILHHIETQIRRLHEAGVDIRTSTTATAEAVTAEVVVLATGALPRRPDVPGVIGPGVLDAWQLLSDPAAVVGERVAVIAQDDHIAPLAIADHLALRGCAVTLFHQTNAPAPLLSRYSLGSILGRLSRGGVQLVAMEEVVGIDLPAVTTRNIYSKLERVHDGFDTLVLACGGRSRTELAGPLSALPVELHVIGDAYAPRRLVNATRHAHAIARAI